MTAVIPSIILKHSDSPPRSIDKFFRDCHAGTLPAVSFVDPALGVLVLARRGRLVAVAAGRQGYPGGLGPGFDDSSPAATEEDPQSMYYGEAWAHRVVEAVLQSARVAAHAADLHLRRARRLLRPRRATRRDRAGRHPAALAAEDPPGGYDMYGPRVPAVVVSPYSRPHGVTDVVHDHTSVLATIEAKWNLPALTNRDANAATVMDFLDVTNAPLLHPPTILGPLATGPSGPTKAT